MKQLLFSPCLISLLFLVNFMACGPGSDQSDKQEDVLLDSLADMELKMSAEILCPEGKNTICEYGIRVGQDSSFVELGDYVGDVIVEDEGIVVEDAIENQGGYIWVTRTIQLPKDAGTLVFEGNFIDDRQANDSLLQESTVNRIQILSTEFRTPEGLGLGSPFGQILEYIGEEGVGIVRIPDFGYVDIQIGQSRIHYLISDQFLAGGEEEEITADQIPAELPVEMIVVM